MGSYENTGTSCNVKCCIATTLMKDRVMSPQLTLSSLFCVLALAGLCVVTAARDISGVNAPAFQQQAELAPGLLHG